MVIGSPPYIPRQQAVAFLELAIEKALIVVADSFGNGGDRLVCRAQKLQGFGKADLLYVGRQGDIFSLAKETVQIVRAIVESRGNGSYRYVGEMAVDILLDVRQECPV